MIAHLTEYSSLLDTHGDQVLESAVAELLEDGEVQRHVRRVRRVYHARRDATAALLANELGDAMSLTLPAGGTAMWVRVTERRRPAAMESARSGRGRPLRNRRPILLRSPNGSVHSAWICGLS